MYYVLCILTSLRVFVPLLLLPPFQSSSSVSCVPCTPSLHALVPYIQSVILSVVGCLRLVGLPVRPSLLPSWLRAFMLSGWVVVVVVDE